MVSFNIHGVPVSNGIAIGTSHLISNALLEVVRYDIKTKKHIGTINIVVNRYNSAEIGLMIGDTSFWGESASDEAMILVLDFSFNELKINPFLMLDRN